MLLQNRQRNGKKLPVILHLKTRHAEQIVPLPQIVEADAVGLKQSLLNILTNAMKFTAPGGALYVETERLGEKGVAVRVRDPGPGMTKGAVARLLTDRAGPASDKKPAIRPGLGLPQVRAFCRANNAELSIDSILKRGTTVAILLTR